MTGEIVDLLSQFYEMHFFEFPLEFHSFSGWSSAPMADGSIPSRLVLITSQRLLSA